MLLSLIKKSFNQVVENNSIILFVISYMIVTCILALNAKTSFLIVAMGICAILLTVVFFSGWLQLINSVALAKDEESQEKNVFSIFLEGIGKNIVSVIIALILYFMVLGFILYITGFVANHFFGDINIIFKDILASAGENNNIIEIIKSLPTEKQYVLYGWQFCLIIGSCVLGFLYMFYCPFLINCEKNMFVRPFVALWESLKFTFKNFLNILGLYVTVYVTYVIISILRALTESNLVISLIMLIVYIYFLTIVIMLIFNYYEAKNNSADGSDSIGENKAVDTAGENN